LVTNQFDRDVKGKKKQKIGSRIEVNALQEINTRCGVQ
jgi:hypothetical protein